MNDARRRVQLRTPHGALLTALFWIGVLLMLFNAPIAEGADKAAPPTSGTGGSLAQPCEGCHGEGGNGTDRVIPKLAGQVVPQLLKQIEDIRSGDRVAAEGLCCASVADSQDAIELAEWFSSQVRSPGQGNSKLAADGEELFRYGDPAAGIVACGGCHNRRGQGYDIGIPGGSPALRAQHADYIVNQLYAFRDGSRTNDWNWVMGNIAARLSDEQIRTVAAFVSGLP